MEYLLIALIASVIVYGVYRAGFDTGYRVALKRTYDAECGKVSSESDWENMEGIFRGALHTRLEKGGITCVRCGWKTGEGFGGVPLYRCCAVCFARLGLSVSAKRYVSTGIGPYCAFHFDEAVRIDSGQLRAFTLDHKSNDEPG